MIKMKYYKELPNGYKEVYSIDAGNTKTGLILNLIGLPIMIVMFIILMVIKSLVCGKINFDLSDGKTSLVLFILCIVMILYIIIHELTHGLFYKFFTKEKLKFGLKLTCAYCGVPTIYMKKIPMIITALAPFVIYSLIGVVLMIVVPYNVIFLAIDILFSAHAAGCVGDIYVSFLLIKYPKETLVNDTGAKQTFYILDRKEDELCESLN